MHLGRRYDGQLDIRREDHPSLQSLRKRAASSNNSNVAIAVAALITGLVVIFAGYITLRILRTRGYEPKFVPTELLKRKWRNWQPRRTYNQVPHETRLNPDTAYRGPRDEATSGNGGDNTGDAGAGVDRHTSVRSVMTLPAYSPNPKASEQIIGREGERAGMDMVVEFPESANEEEARREEQMESLYQIRLARRIEQEEREERRRQRREARNRSDWDRLNELRQERRARASSQTSGQSGNGSNLTVDGGNHASSAALIAEHQSHARERRVAAVTYAEVGHVRHDGTRLRANSQDSDSRPLLDAAASMDGASGGRDSPAYAAASRSRGNSAASSVMSASTANSDFDHLPSASNISNSNPIPQTRPSSHDLTPRDSTDVTDATVPPPPDYEHLQWGEAPAYESPVVGQGEEPERREFPSQAPQIQLSTLSVLPSIEIETATPANSAPNTPATPTMRSAEEQEGTDSSTTNTTTVTTER